MEGKCWRFWNETLKAPKYVLAPMVSMSELVWRDLARQYGADLCYTPMFHAKLFGESKVYREKNFPTDETDRPLVVQFSGNDPAVLLRAARHVVGRCEAIDINLGCPQKIAKRGRYGSFLQDEWELIEEIVRHLVENIETPVSCKIRIFDEAEKTVAYAKMLEKAGCSFICVHGRTRGQIGENRGEANWAVIGEIKKAVSIPVIANGGIGSLEDARRCFEETGVDAVMAGYSHLLDPQMFSEKKETKKQVVARYRSLCTTRLEQFKKRKYFVPSLANSLKGHLMKMFRKDEVLREKLAEVYSVEGFLELMEEIGTAED
ncbi:MAG: tRNA dihydrouridine synthase [Amphiamblys sp. WSBS2006]|nr:MAG: tRNA dihydrouridine synthase [Amphiamblys sp. WSBS2006]